LRASSRWRAAGGVHDDDHRGADLDTRAGALDPTARQRELARGLRALVEWNRFGTPSSLVVPGGRLAEGVPGATAADAARAWLSANRALFRLSSMRGLEVVGDARLASSAAHAVTLRQTFDGVLASGGGTVTVGLTPAGGAWDVVSASSTATGNERLAGRHELGAERAWQRAARSVGRAASLAQISRAGADKLRGEGWQLLEAPRTADLQRVREVAFPTVRRGVLPAYEALVLDSAGPEPVAFRVFVDGRTGAVLAREDLVEHSHEPPPAPVAFAGRLPEADGACDVRKGPFPVDAEDHVRAIDVVVEADPLRRQDLVLRLYAGADQVAEVDTFTSPERLRYAPPGGVPAGEYFVEVCEARDGSPPVEPRDYRGTLTLDTTIAPAEFLARWRTFPATPPLARLTRDPWLHPSTDTREQWCWRATEDPVDCDRVVGNLASRAPWDHDVRTNAPTSTTAGNNAVTAESWTDPLVPAPTQFRPVSPQRDYAFPWTNAWNRRDCDPGTPYGAAFVPGQSMDVAAAVTNLFVQHNRMHDWSYHLGFTEEAWNAQASNFGRTEPFQENDPLLGDAQAGATLPPPAVYGRARNNANMITLPDGQSSITNMYLWQPVAGGFYPPCVDGDYDASVIGHEYTHMIENRMIGKGANRSGHHAGAMGESHSDLLAQERLLEEGVLPVAGESPWAVGAYVTGNGVRGIRNYAGDFPTTGAFPTPSRYPRVNPLNFSDIGYDLTGPQVHADGEIWTATNVDVRRALAAKYAAAFPEGDAGLQRRCAEGELPADRCPGNRRWIQLVVDAFLLMPTAPSMLDARNAMLAADTVRFAGENQAELWGAFARRGFGPRAASTNTTGRAAGVESDTDPAPDFESPREASAVVTFTATGVEPGAPAVPARVFVGHYEGRVSPVADTDPATRAPAELGLDNLDAEAAFAPGTYELVVTAPGYGHQRLRQTFRAGTRPTVALRLQPNLASAGRGASATGDAAPVTSPTSDPPGAEILSREQVLRRLIDDTEATNWQAAAREVDGAWQVDGRQVTVDLAGDAPQTLRRVQVSAMLGPVFDPRGRPNPGDLGQNRFTALRQFELWICDASAADCRTDAGFERVLTSAPDAFPADAPRPVAPALQLRTFALPPVRATHLRLLVRTNQCTGGPDFQGEQDADPFNATDCDTAGPASTRFVRAAELQAFGR
jgi:hypothetical protein